MLPVATQTLRVREPGAALPFEPPTYVDAAVYRGHLARDGASTRRSGGVADRDSNKATVYLPADAVVTVRSVIVDGDGQPWQVRGVEHYRHRTLAHTRCTVTRVGGADV